MISSFIFLSHFQFIICFAIFIFHPCGLVENELSDDNWSICRSFFGKKCAHLFGKKCAARDRKRLWRHAASCSCPRHRPDMDMMADDSEMWRWLNRANIEQLLSAVRSITRSPSYDELSAGSIHPTLVKQKHMLNYHTVVQMSMMAVIFIFCRFLLSLDFLAQITATVMTRHVR